MTTNNRLRIFYVLHPGETVVPPVLKECAHVIPMRAGGVPDLSALEHPPKAIVVGPPIDDDMQRALQRMEVLDLPFVGFGTGKILRLDASVSATIHADDLKTVLELICERAEVLHMDADQSDHPLTTRCLSALTDSVTRMIEHIMTLRIPEYQKRTDRVVQACLWIGTHLGMTESELNVLIYAARLREIGKLGLPDRILFASRSERTPAEQKLYDRYPELGAQAVAELTSLKSSARVIECQLENFDGSGPGELESHQIPLGSRILRVAGAYEMISSNAPSGTTSEEIMTIMERHQGSLYDPLLVKLVQNYHYLSNAGTTEARRTRRIRLADIAEGMVLAEDIWSRNGMKIVPRGTHVTTTVLNLLQGSPLDSSLEAVEVFSGAQQSDGGGD